MFSREEYLRLCSLRARAGASFDALTRGGVARRARRDGPPGAHAHAGASPMDLRRDAFLAVGGAAGGLAAAGGVLSVLIETVSPP